MHAGGGDPVARGVIAALLIYGAAIISMPLSESMRTLMMRRFHADTWPFAAWAAIQPVPSMYNFENHWRVLYDRLEAPDCKNRTEYDNHHTFGRFSIPFERYRFDRCGGALVIYSTRYRGTVVESTYRIDKKPEGTGYHVRRLK